MKSAPGPALSSPLPECPREPAPAQLPRSGAGALPPALRTALPAGLAQQGARPWNSAVPGGSLCPHALSTPWDGGPPDSAHGLAPEFLVAAEAGGVITASSQMGFTALRCKGCPAPGPTHHNALPAARSSSQTGVQVTSSGGDLLAGKLDSASPQTSAELDLFSVLRGPR